MSSIRLTGLVSGMDTDQMVKDLMKAERAKLDRVNQNKQISIWKQEKFREITDKLKAVQTSYFNPLDATHNLWSKNMFGQFTTTAKSGGIDSKAVTAQGTADLKSNNITINSVSKLATKDTWVGSKTNLRGIKTNGLDLAAAKANANGVNFLLAIDGTTKEIHLTQAEISGFTTEIELKDALNTKIGEVFGSDFNDIVSESAGELTFDKTGNRIVILPKKDQASSLTELGMSTSGEASDGFETKTLADLFGAVDGSLSGITINGVSGMGITSSDTIEEAIAKINKSEAGVTISYDSLNDKYSMKSNKFGSANNITLGNTNTEDFLSDLGISDGAGRTKGENAVVEINGTTITKESNTFEFDGALITLNEVHTTGTPIDLNFTVNKEPIKETIKGFVEKYNETIKELNDLITEKKNYDYKPLTAEQRKELSDDEVKEWDKKAKAGLLRNSNEIASMLTKMRQALYEPIDGLGITLNDIGITSSKFASEDGKLEIDESTLDKALENNYDNVVKLFTSESSTKYLDGNGATRYSENGIGHRIDDIINDYARTTRDDDGNKGIFVDKAGVTGSPLGQDTISKEILAFNTRIDKLQDYLSDKETAYYTQFASMERALSQLNSQSSWIAQQMGS